MKTYRIIEISGKLDLSCIYDSIISLPFVDISGFTVDRKRKDVIEAVHVYKKEIIRKINLISGSEDIIKYFDYIKTQFKVINILGRIFVILINPPRENRVFNKDLKHILPRFTALKNVCPKPIDFYYNILNKGIKVDINEIDISNVNVNNKGLARFIFSSDKDIYNDAMSFIDKKDFFVRSLIMSIEQERSTCKCKVSSSGNISMSGDHEELLNRYIVS